MSKGKDGKQVPHPSGVYHRYTWMGNSFVPRANRKRNSK